MTSHHLIHINQIYRRQIGLALWLRTVTRQENVTPDVTWKKSVCLCCCYGCELSCLSVEYLYWRCWVSWRLVTLGFSYFGKVPYFFQTLMGKRLSIPRIFKAWRRSLQNSIPFPDSRFSNSVWTLGNQRSLCLSLKISVHIYFTSTVCLMS